LLWNSHVAHNEEMRRRWLAGVAFASAASAFACANLDNLSRGQPDAGGDTAAHDGSTAGGDAMQPAPDASDANPGDGGDASSQGITRRQALVAGNTKTTSLNMQSVTVTAGDLLVVAAYWSDSAAGLKVTDSFGNAWTAIPEVNNAGNNAEIQIWYAENAKGGKDDTVTAAQQTTTPSYMGFYLLEYGGILSTSSLDLASGQIAGTSSNTMSAGPMQTSAPLDLIVALFSDTCAPSPCLMTPATGFTAAMVDTGFGTMVEDDAPLGVGHGSYTPTATLPANAGPNGANGCWAAAAAAFKAQ
jgi:hypothetical protein